MPKTFTGRMGMTKAMKRAARLSSMTSNRKRDKAAQRADYHRQFDHARGQRPPDYGLCGFTKQKTVHKD